MVHPGIGKPTTGRSRRNAYNDMISDSGQGYAEFCRGLIDYGPGDWLAVSCTSHGCDRETDSIYSIRANAGKSSGWLKLKLPIGARLELRFQVDLVYS